MVAVRDITFLLIGLCMGYILTNFRYKQLLAALPVTQPGPERISVILLFEIRSLFCKEPKGKEYHYATVKAYK